MKEVDDREKDNIIEAIAKIFKMNINGNILFGWSDIENIHVPNDEWINRGDLDKSLEEYERLLRYESWIISVVCRKISELPDIKDLYIFDSDDDYMFRGCSSEIISILTKEDTNTSTNRIYIFDHNFMWVILINGSYDMVQFSCRPKPSMSSDDSF